MGMHLNNADPHTVSDSYVPERVNVDSERKFHGGLGGLQFEGIGEALDLKRRRIQHHHAMVIHGPGPLMPRGAVRNKPDVIFVDDPVGGTAEVVEASGCEPCHIEVDGAALRVQYSYSQWMPFIDKVQVITGGPLKGHPVFFIIVAKGTWKHMVQSDGQGIRVQNAHDKPGPLPSILGVLPTGPNNSDRAIIHRKQLGIFCAQETRRRFFIRAVKHPKNAALIASSPME